MGADPDLIRRQIEQTRGLMGETIDAIAYKADVQARARDKVSDAVDRAKESVAGAAASIRDAADHVREKASRTARDGEGDPVDEDEP